MDMGETVNIFIAYTTNNDQTFSEVEQYSWGNGCLIMVQHGNRYEIPSERILYIKILPQ
jgi:hypothetical protein